MSDTYSKMRRQRDRKAHQLGGGTWFRKSDRLQVRVDVQFYPKTRLCLNEAGSDGGFVRREITLDELQRDYERLRL